MTWPGDHGRALHRPAQVVRSYRSCAHPAVSSTVTWRTAEQGTGLERTGVRVAFLTQLAPVNESATRASRLRLCADDDPVHTVGDRLEIVEAEITLNPVGVRVDSKDRVPTVAHMRRSEPLLVEYASTGRDPPDRCSR